MAARYAAHACRARPHAYHGFVNPPRRARLHGALPERRSDAGAERARYSYGLTNTPTIEALTKALTALDGAAGTVLVPSGLAAVTTAILVAARPGKRILVPDNVYAPTRRFCDETPAGIRRGDGLLRPADRRRHRRHARRRLRGCSWKRRARTPSRCRTCRRMVAAARAAGIMTMIDNTWATPLIYRPLEHGIDLAIYAGTKYQAGHSDLLIGSISANEAAWPALQRLHKNLGIAGRHGGDLADAPGAADHGRAAGAARAQRAGRSRAGCRRGKEVARVLHPALPDDPGHAIWKRDFGRSTGLFGFVLNGEERGAKAFLERAAALRARLFLGRLREPGGAWRAGALPHRAAVDRGADHPPAYRAGGRRAT